jgi:hypothetical protein
MSDKPDWMKSIKKKPKLKTAEKKAGTSSGPSDYAKQQFKREQAAKAEGKSFTEALDPQSLEYFNEVCSRPFAEQAQFFLNAFWDEFSDHAEAVYAIHWRICKKVEMDSQGIAYLHLYEEGIDLDFDIGLVLFEQINLYFKNTAEGKADAAKYPLAVPEHMTSIVRKKELRDKVDVNFDGRVGFLEYLLYQFKASPKTLMERSTRSQEEGNPELDAARAALAEVNKRIKAYEAEKHRLQTIIDTKTGTKQLGAINLMAQVESGPLAEQLRAALITAEAKVRIVARKTKTKLTGGLAGAGGDGEGGQPRTDGTIWWMQREIAEKKKLYGPRGNAGGKKAN